MRTLSYEMLNDHFCFYFNIFFGKNFYRREFASCKPLYRNKKWKIKIKKKKRKEKKKNKKKNIKIKIKKEKIKRKKRKSKEKKEREEKKSCMMSIDTQWVVKNLQHFQWMGYFFYKKNKKEKSFLRRMTPLSLRSLFSYGIYRTMQAWYMLRCATHVI